MTPRVGVITFPGSLDDRDALRAVAVMGGEPVTVWHANPDLSGADALILPGGFSYGDYLRTGAIARFAPVMDAVREFAERGGPVLGICNGFQILCEAGLLPGALIRNRGLSFICRWVNLRPEAGVFGESGDRPAVLQMPIKHGEGQFVVEPEELAGIEAKGLVALRYCSPQGAVDEAFNPNGATAAIAGIRNEAGNVLGLMPHPEHAVDPDLGPTGGQVVLDWLLTPAGARTRVNV
ncbi:MAG TPA: phosphoribosylformylglycinamidine synthase subunit PurQ [Actinomycetota bacterium]|nr:phosphoribosylformylglycinamidine synthase subunit PurQ [Actinomycetota bacterium]